MAKTRRNKAAAKPATGVRGGADEALERLVSQFSDPFAFIRELVQNSIDAGALRIDVEVTVTPCERRNAVLLGIAVADTGDGMTAEIIDDYLVTLFRSTKEDDLTKIGKFGIGFVSVFALAPDLVVVETARAGECWRVLFHPDRRYERTPKSEPMEGTRVELLKYVSPADAEKYVKQAHAALVRWCGHAGAHIEFKGPDGTTERVDRPLDLEADDAWPSVRCDTEIGTAVVGVPRRKHAVHAFYNQGLLLHEGPAADSASPWDRRLQHVSFKLDSPLLEHTLTRDNVLDGPKLQAAMAEVHKIATDKLVPAVIAELQRLALSLSRAADPQLSAPMAPVPPATPEVPATAPSPASAPSLGSRRRRGPPDGAAADDSSAASERLQAYVRLLRWVLVEGGAGIGSANTAPIIPVLLAPPMSVSELLARAERGGVLKASKPDHVVVLAHAAGDRVLPNAILDAIAADEALAGPLRPVLSCRSLHATYFAPLPARGEHKQALAELSELLGAAALYRRQVRVGRLDYDDSPVGEALLVRQEKAFALSPLAEGLPGTLFGGPREIVLNEAHPVIRDTLALASTAPLLAAAILARLLTLLERGGEIDARKLIDAVVLKRTYTCVSARRGG